MTRSRFLLIASFALSMFGTGQVWLVQMSSYKLWSFVGRQEWPAYHQAWWHSIWGVVLAPSILLFIAAVLMLWWRAPGVPLWAAQVGVALQVALLLGTALWWGPLMAHLMGADGGLPVERYYLLLTTHWLRVGIVSAYALLCFGMTIKGFLWSP